MEPTRQSSGDTVVLAATQQGRRLTKSTYQLLNKPPTALRLTV